MAAHMSRRHLTLALVVVVVAFFWGFASGHREVFPFHELLSARQLVLPEPHAEAPPIRPPPRMTAQEAARTIFAGTPGPGGCRHARHSIPLSVVATIECERSYCGRALDRVRKLKLVLSKWTHENGIPLVDLNDELSSADGLRPTYTWTAYTSRKLPIWCRQTA
jgi:hypothetical protein